MGTIYRNGIPYVGTEAATQVHYDNTYSGMSSTSVQGAIDELKTEIGDTDISGVGDGSVTGAIAQNTDDITALNNGLGSLAHYAISSAPLAVNGTYQIPTSVLNHKIVILIFRRYGHIGNSVLLSENIRDGVATEGSTVYPYPGTNYTYKINGTGLLTLTAITGNIEPYIQVVGIL